MGFPLPCWLAHRYLHAGKNAGIEAKTAIGRNNLSLPICFQNPNLEQSWMKKGCRFHLSATLCLAACFRYLFSYIIICHTIISTPGKTIAQTIPILLAGFIVIWTDDAHLTFPFCGGGWLKHQIYLMVETCKNREPKGPH